MCVCGCGGAAPIPCVQDTESAPSTHIRSTLLFVLDKRYLQWRSSSLTDVAFNRSLHHFQKQILESYGM